MNGERSEASERVKGERECRAWLVEDPYVGGGQQPANDTCNGARGHVSGAALSR